MLDENQFRQNIERWAELHADVAPALEQPCTGVQFHTNPNGSLNLRAERKGKMELLHAPDPVAEAEEWFSSLNLRNIRVLVIFGVGLGYYYEAALQWLRSDPDHYLVFLENNLEVIKCLLRTERGSVIVHDDQVWLDYLYTNPSSAENIAVIFAPMEYTVTALTHYKITQSSTLMLIEELVDVMMNGRKQILAEFFGSKTFYKNLFSNFALLSHSYFGNRLFGQFQNIPAIICGAGPSLAHSLPQLETLKDRALIFAGGTAMNAVNTTGLIPHFGVGVDPNAAQFTRLIMNQAFETPYFYRNRMYHDALNLIQGDRLYVAGSSQPILHWIEERLGLIDEDIDTGYNVINFSLAIAAAMGCNPIVFVGVDLAYTDGLSYCPGILNHPLHEKKKFFRTKYYRWLI